MKCCVPVCSILNINLHVVCQVFEECSNLTDLVFFNQILNQWKKCCFWYFLLILVIKFSNDIFFSIFLWWDIFCEWTLIDVTRHVIWTGISTVVFKFTTISKLYVLVSANIFINYFTRLLGWIKLGCSCNFWLWYVLNLAWCFTKWSHIDNWTGIWRWSSRSSDNLFLFGFLNIICNFLSHLHTKVASLMLWTLLSNHWLDCLSRWFSLTRCCCLSRTYCWFFRTKFTCRNCSFLQWWIRCFNLFCWRK